MEPLIIEELSREFLFSEDAIRAIERAYPNNALEVLQALKSPPPWYTIRVNSLKTTIERLVRELREIGVDATPHPSLDDCLLVRIRGPFKVPLESKYVVVDKVTAESVLLGANVYAPGIKKCTGVHKGDRVNIVDVHGQIVAAGVTRLNEAEILSTRSGLAVEITATRYRVPSLRETLQFRQGLIFPQSVAAIVTGHVLDPKPGEKILDMNCAPGGKLSHVCQLTKNQASVIGVDRRSRKIDATKETLTRLSCNGVQLLRHDSRYLDRDFPTMQVDKVIVDPPCSALGLNPKLYEDITLKEIADLANYQKQFLNTASQVVRRKGVILYSVCTITIDECEEIVSYAQEKLGLELVSQEPVLGAPGLWEDAKLAQRFHPHIQQTGFFIAKFFKP